MMTDFTLDRDHPLGLAEQIASRVATGIEAGELSPGERLPSERELVRLFQVSKDTVRKALGALVGRGLVIKSPSRGTFVASADLLARKREHGRVHVFLVMDETVAWVELIPGLSRELHHQGLDLLLKDVCGWSASDLRRVVEASIAETPAGVILYPYFHDELAGFYRSLAKADVPVVMVDAGMDLGLDAVVADELEGISLGIRHLYAQGHRRIGYVPHVGRACEHGRRRVEAFREVSKTLGLKGADGRICPFKNAGDASRCPAGVQKQIVRFLKSAPEVTGVVCYNDWVAMHVWSAAEAVGRCVPGDLSIVGFDNDSMAENWARPLTTIDPEMIRMGATAARRLIAVADRPADAPAEVVCVPAKLVIRQSTAPPPSAGAKRDNTHKAGKRRSPQPRR